jgi:hypothetical protein
MLSQSTQHLHCYIIIENILHVVIIIIIIIIIKNDHHICNTIQ